MEHLFEFISNHPLLIAGFVFVAVLLTQDLITNGTGKNQLDAKGATELINGRDAVVIDVRPNADFLKGHIINAENVPMSGLSGQIERLKKYQGKPIIVSCNSGGQSSTACRMLRKAGFDPVYNLKGGMLAWQNDNFPVSRKRK